MRQRSRRGRGFLVGGSQPASETAAAGDGDSTAAAGDGVLPGALPLSGRRAAARAARDDSGCRSCRERGLHHSVSLKRLSFGNVILFSCAVVIVVHRGRELAALAAALLQQVLIQILQILQILIHRRLIGLRAALASCGAVRVASPPVRRLSALLRLRGSGAALHAPGATAARRVARVAEARRAGRALSPR